MTRMIRKYAQVQLASRSKPTCLFVCCLEAGQSDEPMLSLSLSEIAVIGRRQEEEEEDGSSPPSSTHTCFSEVVQGQHDSLRQSETQTTQQRPAATFRVSRENLGLLFKNSIWLDALL